MNNDQLIASLADKARSAARTLRRSEYSVRQGALLSIATAIEDRHEEILSANQRDVSRERAGGMSESDRKSTRLNSSHSSVSRMPSSA